ncbi:c-type cytochrome [Pseudomonas fluorescens]|uniref:Thiosulfate dehydrogenase n=1 Tax=Pseudomonas fluorescens TaxID=294 RepID=A0A944DYE0_PSEFL|nr:c-type cytochrome [Pseudomonas fluorescens]MBT2297642.1 c-type cytochrome [Pseudomonas fluorescens]MBT2305841.1 c-type cytochrome [Pseudomonas fluorescens]MBT2314137.1 c-type cytochrome [Pseudomonas fluorescens]MBT2319371.1 c-type cytochrome [Pseudomonas fluorescens]MBT2329211.1 c-type cytochrome [Pseudomonas fluorescens]
MKSFIAALISCNMISMVCATEAVDSSVPAERPGTPQAAVTTFTSPAEDTLPDNAFGQLVQQGHAIFVATKANAPEFVGNGLSCTNCHLEQGRKADSAPLWGAYPMYPAYRKKNNKVNTYAERIQGCFQFSMNGKPPPADSQVIAALTAYSYWLATGAPTGQALPGRSYPEVPEPVAGFDLVKGKAIYAAQCAVCHANDGQGQKAGGEYVFPPLWGKDSFNWGAGMHRINTAAGFIKSNMPLGKGGTLSADEAWHVAAYMNSHERPKDPRMIAGSVEQTRLKFHADDGVNLYGQEVNGVILGRGTQ